MNPEEVMLRLFVFAVALATLCGAALMLKFTYYVMLM